MINTVVDGNFLKIELPSGTRYMNPAWVAIDFTKTSVIFTDQGRNNSGVRVEIPFDKFQYDGVDYSTESTIFDAIKTVIG